MNLMESQWKLRQQHDQNFPMERKSFVEKPCIKTKRVIVRRKRSKKLSEVRPVKNMFSREKSCAKGCLSFT